MSDTRSAGAARRPYAEPSRTNNRRTATAAGLLVAVGVNEAPLRIVADVHHHPVALGVMWIIAGALALDLLLEGAVKLRRRLAGKIIVINFGATDQPPTE
ncbi:hypothetical protein OG836_27060 [Micromonospora zamorensis]|uniref:hypothetical protein n=1 Tax=Micromonospora zamorensis TaxID=709883 RepID=UPI002E1B339B|nr:hypothetical protein OG423_15915 [Micromonospora zamorensis]